MSSGLVISGSMVSSFLENRPFTRSLSGRRMAAPTIDVTSQPALHREDNRTDTDLLTSWGEATLPSPGALNNHDDMSQFLRGLEPSLKWPDLLAKHGEWPLAEELPSLFDAHPAFLPRTNGDATMLDTEEGINGSVEQTQPAVANDVNMGDVDNGNGNVDEEAAGIDATGASDMFLSSLFDWDKLGSPPPVTTEEAWQTGPSGQGGPTGSALMMKSPSAAKMRFTRSRSFELRKLVEKKGYPADTVMRAIDEGRVDPAVVWAKAAAENAAASRPGQAVGENRGQAVDVNRGQAEGNDGPGGVNKGVTEKGKGRLPDMTEELKRLVNQRTQNTVPIRSSRRSPAPSPVSCLSPRLRQLLDAQLPDTPSDPFSLDGAPAEQVAQKAPAPLTVPLTQPRYRGRPQPLKGLTSAHKFDMLRPTTSDPSSLSRKRGPSTEMLPPVKRSSSNSSDLDVGRTSSSISEVVRAYSEIRTSTKAPPAKVADTKRRGRAEKESKPARNETPQPAPPAPTPKRTAAAPKPHTTALNPKPSAAPRAAASPRPLPTAEQTHIQLLVKAQRADQLEEENRGLKQYLQFLSKKDGLQTKLIEQLEQQLVRLTDEKTKLMTAARKR